MLSLDYYHKIIHALKHPKRGIDVKFHGWCKQHFKIDSTSGVETLCSQKSNRRIVIVEPYYIECYNKVRWLVMVDIHPFENEFFKMISQNFLFLKSLTIVNRESQKNKQDSSTCITFPSRFRLVLSVARTDYVAQFFPSIKILVYLVWWIWRLNTKH